MSTEPSSRNPHIGCFMLLEQGSFGRYSLYYFMQNGIDLTKVLTKEHSEKWVAFSSDYKKVLGYSADLIELRKQMGSNEEVVYLKMPESGRRYAF